MIRNVETKFNFLASLVAAILFHLVILLFVKKSNLEFNIASLNTYRSAPIKIDRIQLIRPDEIPMMKKVGIKNGAKDKYFRPDNLKIPKLAPPKIPGLSLSNLTPDLPAPKMTKKPEGKTQDKSAKNSALSETLVRPNLGGDEERGHFYFNPKKEKKIIQTHDQDTLKQEAFKNITTSNSNPVADKMSNFEIRYERPEGVSEDELNSDEKAYYSFYKRSYANYLSKLYATYDKVSIERPGLEKAFEGKHLLIGKIDYDDKGNIVTVKILKSSENDDVHYFFEETLKQLNLPNPPKSYIKNKKAFTTYYQIQIN